MMAKNKNYEYSADAGSSSRGRMQCSVCGKKITEGQYRYHETPNAYVTAHRGCCPDDLAWKKLDREAAERKLRRDAMYAEAIAFRSKWGIDCLDELISELREESK